MEKSVVVAPSSLKLNQKLAFMLRSLHKSKVSFLHLKTEIIKGLAEAKDVFTSISIPLLRLVDLKVDEMEKDGRRTSVFMTDIDFEAVISSQYNNASSEYEAFPSVTNCKRNLLRGSEGENFKSKAAYHTEEIVNIQKCQMQILIGLLKRIESLVRSQERDITERFDDHHNFVGRMQKKFISEITSLHHSLQSMNHRNARLKHDLSTSEQGYKALLTMTLKLQQSVFDGFRKALTRLKEEMDAMVNDLASHMCEPLLSYMKRLKSEGTVSVVRQLQLLVEQMETDFIRHIPSLLTANDRLLVQLRNSKMQLNACEDDLKRAMQNIAEMNKAMVVKEHSNIALKNALAKKGEETQEIRKRMRTQSKRILELETDIKEIDGKRTQERRALCAKEKEISSIKGQKDAALQRSKDLGCQMSLLETENFRLKKMVESASFCSRSNEEIVATVDKTAKGIMNWVKEMKSNNAKEEISQEKLANGFMDHLHKKLKERLHANSDQYFPSLSNQKVGAENNWQSTHMEEKLGDECLWEILKIGQHGVSCSNPNPNRWMESNNPAVTAAGSAGGERTKCMSSTTRTLTIKKRDGKLLEITSTSPCNRQGLFWDGQGSAKAESGPITRSCARRMLETTQRKTSVSVGRNNSPSSLPWDLRIFGKRDSPNTLLHSSPRLRP